MKRLVAIITASLTTVAQAQHDGHAHHGKPIEHGSAHVVVTINPEVRVSAAVAAPPSPPPMCGSAMKLSVKVINQGFVTAPLRAMIVGDGARHVALRMDDKKLSGKPEDSRILHLTPSGPEATDVTIAFSVDGNIGSHGERDRVHLFVRCVSDPK